MLEMLILIAAAVVLHRQLAGFTKASPAAPATLVPSRATPQLAQQAAYADRLYNEKRWVAAEKAYLVVLKADHKNVTAYSHLGIIYSTQKNYGDAIECFVIAARLRPSASTQQNLGLVYYENRNYIKAIAAFEKAIMFEASPQRYIGLSKAYRKLKDMAHMLTALERAADLDPSKRVLDLLAEAYEETGRIKDAKNTYQRIHELDPADARAARKIGLHLPDDAPEA